MATPHSGTHLPRQELMQVNQKLDLLAQACPDAVQHIPQSAAVAQRAMASPLLNAAQLPIGGTIIFSAGVCSGQHQAHGVHIEIYPLFIQGPQLRKQLPSSVQQGIFLVLIQSQILQDGCPALAKMRAWVDGGRCVCRTRRLAVRASRRAKKHENGGPVSLLYQLSYFCCQ